MSDLPSPGPGGVPGWPAGFDLNQLVRMLGSAGPVNWEVAEQVATSLAVADPQTAAPGSEPSWSQSEADALIGLVRAAQTNVAGTTALAGVHGIEPRVIGRSELARASLRGLRTVLEALAVALSPAPGPDEGPPTDLGANPFAALASEEGLAALMRTLAPVLLGVQAGTMAGYLAQHGFGRYDQALPFDDDPDIALLPGTLREFAQAWELPVDDVSFAIALRETVRAGQRTTPWVNDSFVEATVAFVSGYEAGGAELEHRLDDLDVTNPQGLGDLFGDPTALLGMMRSPAQEPARARLKLLVSVLEGYTDVVVAEIGERLVPTFGRIDEAVRRRRLDRGEAGALLEQLLGLDLGRADYEAGHAFCRGVVEREGISGLDRLWERAEHVPTPAELEAPGLWLARIDLG